MQADMTEDLNLAANSILKKMARVIAQLVKTYFANKKT